MKHTPLALIILDGFGYRAEKIGNAIALAHTPHLDAWLAQYPHTLLKASGSAVGLPEGFMGNSEVGHSTIGAGRVIEQTVTKMNNMIDDGSFLTNKPLVDCLQKARATSNRVHIMGLASDAGIHCMTKHLIAYLKAAHMQGIKNIYFHAFLDGRDTGPKSATRYLEELDAAITSVGTGIIGSIHGRFYAMDRDKHWDRTQKSYDTLIGTQHINDTSWQSCLETYYRDGISDEFVPPTLLHGNAAIQSGDTIISANFRPDRIRQLTTAFVAPDTVPFATHCHPDQFITPVCYADYLHTQILLAPCTPTSDTLSDILHRHHMRLYAIAETEKYAHVTYFFNGGREHPYETEHQELIPSLPVKNYIAHPEMSAAAITEHVIHSLNTDPYDVYLINYANADMVGHSGNVPATIQAIEILDQELNTLYEVLVKKYHGTMLITADHGNAEEMIEPATHAPKTSHTTNPVPFLAINAHHLIPASMHELKDIKNFILNELNIAKIRK